MFVKRQDIAILTDGSGNFTGFTAEVCQGTVLGLLYTPDGSVPLATTATFTVTTEDTAQPVLTYAPGNSNAFQRYPESPVHSPTDGSALTNRSEHIPLGGQERVKVVIASGGSAKKGILTVLTGG